MIESGLLLAIGFLLGVLWDHRGPGAARFNNWMYRRYARAQERRGWPEDKP